MTFLSGFIAIVGPPNVGKSTLLNRLLGTKVSAVSPKPQTTRNRILGILHGDEYQMVFMDTPGIHKTLTPLHRSMVSSARAALLEVDIIGMMIDAFRPDDPDIELILSGIRAAKKPSILMINKIDRGPKEALLPVMDTFSRRYPFDAVIPISALQGDGVDLLLRELKGRLKPGPQFFPEEVHTDQPLSFRLSEVIREKVFLLTRQELPYSTAVTVERIEEADEKDLVSVYARIHVESDSQKGMLIGKGGKMIKGVGQSARVEMEKIIGCRVFLDLSVRVEKKWSRDPKALRRLGY